jgi:hypothetical protein
MIVAYNGIGANGKIYFSVDEFLHIMRTNFQKDPGSFSTL